MATCPDCGSVVMNGDPYCPHCGAHLNWGFYDDDEDDSYY
nr:zinc-ribbon domain-containing protein [uncultured Methanobrevibacter sp.]